MYEADGDYTGSSLDSWCQGEACDYVRQQQGMKKLRDASYWKVTASSPEDLASYNWLSLPRLLSKECVVQLNREIERMLNEITLEVEVTNQPSVTKLQCYGPRMRGLVKKNQQQIRLSSLKSMIKEHGEEAIAEAIASMIPMKTRYPRLQVFLCGLKARLELELPQVCANMMYGMHGRFHHFAAIHTDSGGASCVTHEASPILPLHRSW